jgi:hypothetical protein
MSSLQDFRKDGTQARAVRGYFDDLRSRFPQGHLGLDAMERSFEVQLTKAAPLFSMFTTHDGIEYLFVVYRNAQVDIFVTIYAVHLGTFSLFQPFPGRSVFDYPCFPEAARGRLLPLYIKYFMDPRRPAKPIGLFGTTSNLGHHLWNEWCGKISADVFLDPQEVDWVSAGYDYLGELSAPVAQLASTHNPCFVHRGRIYRFSSLVVAKSHREAFRRRYDLPCRSEDNAICVQLRFGHRPWPDVLETVPYLISQLYKRRPDLMFIIDGSAKIGSGNEAQISAEVTVYDAIKIKLDSSLQLSSLLGRSFAEKVSVYDRCRYFIAPIGSGGIIPSWFLAKPGLSFGNLDMYEWVAKQEELVPEGGPFFKLFPVRSGSNGSDQVDFEWDAFVDAVVADLR